MQVNTLSGHKAIPYKQKNDKKLPKMDTIYTYDKYWSHWIVSVHSMGLILAKIGLPISIKRPLVIYGQVGAGDLEIRRTGAYFFIGSFDF